MKMHGVELTQNPNEVAAAFLIIFGVTIGMMVRGGLLR